MNPPPQLASATQPPAPTPAPHAQAKPASFFRFWIPSLFLGFAAAATLFFFNPSQHGFYPRCLLFTSTGLLCPGCGGLRAAHHLLHGRFAEAFHLNPLAVLAAPIAAWGILESFLPRPKRQLATLLAHPWAFPVIAGILAGYGIARNIPLPKSFHWPFH